MVQVGISDHLSRAAFLCSIFAVLLLLMASCDSTVDVLQPSDQYHYSLYGVLDVAADTQVIRVDPLGTPSAVGASPGFDATVVLRDRSTGEEIPLQDSLTTVVKDSVRMHNFWTTHPIQPSTSYQIAVTKDGSDLTTVTTTTPAQPPELTVAQPIYLPCVFPNPINPDPQAENTFVVFARNVEHIAAAIIRYPLLQPQGEDTLRTWVSEDHYDEVSDEGNRFGVSAFYRPELVRVNERIDADSGSECPARSDFFQSAARMVVAAGGPKWPAWQDASFEDLARPDTFSNVKGGHGFVGGVYSDTVRVPIAERPPELFIRPAIRDIRVLPRSDLRRPLKLER